MSWKELKKLIDAEMASKNISEDAPIWYIDVSFPDVDICVSEDSETGVCIS